MSSAAAGQLLGGRFEVERLLGSGGFGDVYEARDVYRGTSVALKTLHALDGNALYRLKQEFRVLADVSHRNLVQLYELVSEPSESFFTMELIAGTSLLEWVAPARASAKDAALGPTVQARVESAASRDPALERAAPPDYPRLRDAVAQLAEGLDVLHEAGLLHRDIKPSNVLVAEGGRVVIVDFGIVKDLHRRERSIGQESILGTPAYMAPEQAATLPLTPAADMYSVGALLFEAITGEVPFTGKALEIVMAKQHKLAPRASTLADGVPPDLDELCAELLRIAPDERPSAADVARRAVLGGARAVPAVTRRTSREIPLIGREAQWAALESALERVSRGEAATVLVQGTSGMGKSALVSRFLDQIATRSDTEILAGRCYERESVPFKAFDSIIDALTRTVASMPADDAPAVLPAHVDVLARVFPVLRGIPAVAGAPRRRTAETLSPQALRGRAFEALHDMFTRLGLRRTTTIFIDDLQWCDNDSAALLGGLLVRSDPAPVLTVLGVRLEDRERSAPLRGLIERLQEAPGGMITIDVDALSPADARRLAARLLEDEEDRKFVDAIARESAGSPFFVGELARFVETHREAASRGELRLGTVIAERLGELPPEIRLLLELVAVSGRPFRTEILATATGATPEQTRNALGVLRAARLVRSSLAAASGAVEPYHDRIRETAVAVLPPETLTARHRSLAMALLSTKDPDPQAVCVHCTGAGMLDRAGEYAELAAEQAERTLAFDIAASFYATAIELGGGDQAHAQQLRVRLGDALVNAGRGADAAAAFLRAAEVALPEVEIDLRRRAAEQLLRSGYINEGVEAMRRVLARFGMTIAATPLRAFVALVFMRMYLFVRGLQFRERPSQSLSPAEIARADACGSVAQGLAIVDNVRGAEFQTRNLLLCLSLGEPSRLARAFALEGALVGVQGRTSLPRARKLDAMATALAQRLVSAPLDALITGTRAIALHFCGEFEEAKPHFERAARTLREEPTGGRWELDSVEGFGLVNELYLGNLHTFGRRLPALLREADDRGDLYFATNLRVSESNLAHLFADDPDAATDVIRTAMGRWSRRGFHVQHWYEVHSLANVLLYRGDPAGAQRYWLERWPALRRSFHLRLQLSRIKAFFVRGRIALALAETAPASARPALLADAEREAKRMVGERAWGEGPAALLRAGAEAIRGNAEGTRRGLEAAVTTLERDRMLLHAAVARHHLGGALGGDEGTAMRTAADAWLRAGGVRAPDRLARMFAPGITAPRP